MLLKDGGFPTRIRSQILSERWIPHHWRSLPWIQPPTHLSKPLLSRGSENRELGLSPTTLPVTTGRTAGQSDRSLDLYGCFSGQSYNLNWLI